MKDDKKSASDATKSTNRSRDNERLVLKNTIRSTKGRDGKQYYSENLEEDTSVDMLNP